MALMTLHHWSDWRVGIQELKRVTRQRIVIWTFDPAAIARFWLVRDYLPELLEIELARCPSMDDQIGALEGYVQPVPIPRDCCDGVLGAYWARPESYLDPVVRSGISLFYLLGRHVLTRALSKLERDLRSGVWQRRNAYARTLPELDIGYRLLVVDVDKSGVLAEAKGHSMQRAAVGDDGPVRFAGHADPPNKKALKRRG